MKFYDFLAFAIMALMAIFLANSLTKHGVSAGVHVVNNDKLQQVR